MGKLSELAFEEFCNAHAVQWEAIPTEHQAGTKTPDYFIYPAGIRVAAELKEVEPNAEEREQEQALQHNNFSTLGCTVGDRARDIINTAAKQLRVKAKGQCPALIVIHNPSWFLKHHTESHAIKAAMYGFDTIILGVSRHVHQKPIVLDRKSGPGRKMTDQHNTSISAVAVLDERGLTVYHNVYAAIPLNPKLLTGVASRQFTLGEKSLGEFVEWKEIV
jgi:hypothetical protein